MDALLLARWQFALTALFHFIFPPLTIGLCLFLAILETRYVRTGDEAYRRMLRFWGRLFTINFTIGVVSGLVLQFQLGMNWSNYARFMGDVIGSPLAIEAFAAFFLEATFLGVWTFGWERLSKKAHLACIWLVFAGTLLSALWILTVNSFMQQAVGYTVRNYRVELADFWALLTNPYLFYQLGHVLAAAATTGAFFILGVSAYKLRRAPANADFRQTFRFGAIYGLIGALAVAGIGHLQGQHLMSIQPMKMAAAEALWETEQPAAFSVVAIIDEEAQYNPFSLRIPAVVSFLAYNRFDAEVLGLKDLQTRYTELFGEDEYIPPVTLIFWSFRLMLASGTALVVLAALALYLTVVKKREPWPWLLRVLPFAVPLPFLANSTGWIMTEVGRQPWVVFGILKTSQAASPSISAGAVLFSLIAFTTVYTLLLGVNGYLMLKHIRGTQPSRVR